MLNDKVVEETNNHGGFIMSWGSKAVILKKDSLYEFESQQLLKLKGEDCFSFWNGVYDWYNILNILNI